jgi:hypothetical protein
MPELPLTPLPATPIGFRFVSVTRIAGLAGLPENRDLPLRLGVTEGARAFLTLDPNPALAAVDRFALLGHLMMSWFQGEAGPTEMLERIEKLRAQQAAERIKDYPQGVYLVVEVLGDVTSTPTQIARDLGTAVVALDAVDKVAITTRYRSLVNAAVAALLLGADISMEVVSVLEGVELTLPDGRPLYSYTFTLGTPRLSFGRPASIEDARGFERLLPALHANVGLATPSRLLVDALRKRDDQLEAFILAWAALEMVIRKHTVDCESGKWVNSVPEELRASAAALHEAPRISGPPRYSLGDRMRAFALLYSGTDGDVIATEVNRLRTTFREPLYHEGRFQESSLPVDKLIELVRRLIDSVASRASAVK